MYIAAPNTAPVPDAGLHESAGESGPAPTPPDDDWVPQWVEDGAAGVARLAGELAEGAAALAEDLAQATGLDRLWQAGGEASGSQLDLFPGAREPLFIDGDCPQAAITAVREDEHERPAWMTPMQGLLHCAPAAALVAETSPVVVPQLGPAGELIFTPLPGPLELRASEATGGTPGGPGAPGDRGDDPGRVRDDELRDALNRTVGTEVDDRFLNVVRADLEGGQVKFRADGTQLVVGKEYMLVRSPRGAVVHLASPRELLFDVPPK